MFCTVVKIETARREQSRRVIIYVGSLLIFVHVGEVETFHGEAQAEFETANVVAFRYECVAVAVEVDKLVKQFELFSCQHRAQLIV